MPRKAAVAEVVEQVLALDGTRHLVPCAAGWERGPTTCESGEAGSGAWKERTGGDVGEGVDAQWLGHEEVRGVVGGERHCAQHAGPAAHGGASEVMSFLAVHERCVCACRVLAGGAPRPCRAIAPAART